MSFSRVTILNARTGKPLDTVDGTPTWRRRKSLLWIDDDWWELVVPQFLGDELVGEVSTTIVVRSGGRLSMGDGRPSLQFATDDEAKEYAMTVFLLGDGDGAT